MMELIFTQFRWSFHILQEGLNFWQLGIIPLGFFCLRNCDAFPWEVDDKHGWGCISNWCLGNGCWMVWHRRGGMELGIDPVASNLWVIQNLNCKCVWPINPVIVAISFRLVFWCRWSSWQSVSRWVVFPWNMPKFEVKQEDASDLTINCGIGLKIGIIYHSLDVFGIHFHNKISDSYDAQLDIAQCLEKAI